MKKVLLFVSAIILVFVVMSSCSYNKMVEKEEAVTSQWAQVQNAYQRRSDLIPNLVSTVKGYASHEQKTFTDVVEARSKASQIKISADDLTEEKLKEYQKAQGELGQVVGRLMMLTENYPDLKANQNFLNLQDELSGTENRIALERKRFNDNAKSYNQLIRKFPQIIYAGMFGFKKKAYFEAEQEAQKAPAVSFDN